MIAPLGPQRWSKGGQGRTSDEVNRTASIAAWCIALALLVVAGAVWWAVA